MRSKIRLCLGAADSESHSVLAVREKRTGKSNNGTGEFDKHFYRSSLLTGQDIHLGPPLPLESSALGIVNTFTPFLSSRSLVT